MHALSALVALALSGPGFQAGSPQTRPEATGYKETSSYAQVVAFLEGLVKLDGPMRLEWIGRSPKGQPLPLVVVAKNRFATPSTARAEGKLVVYVQANIHAGEVEGKEAALMLLREFAQNPKHPLLEKLVLLVTPIYNIDGNDNWGPLNRNRPSQDGPDPVGTRANGQGMDLNRDCMKVLSNEMQAVLEHVYAKWDPEAIMDLHTTNGTRHGYPLTYSPPLNPTTDAKVMAYCRDRLLPKIRRDFRTKYKMELFDYGNVEGGPEGRRWATFGSEPRYVTNYGGIRNRVAILSEAASFAPFKVRVEATLNFVKEVLENLARESRSVIAMCREADARLAQWATSATPVEVGIRFAMDQRPAEKVLLEKPNPNDPVARNLWPRYLEAVAMPVFDRFKSTKTSKFPAAYVFDGSLRSLAENLSRHGLTVERLTETTVSGGDFFEVSEVTTSNFQGLRVFAAQGAFRSMKANFAKGSFVVRTGQPMGLVAFHMLEPESLDGAATWGMLGDLLEKGKPFPVVKVFAPFALPTEMFSAKSWR